MRPMGAEQTIEDFAKAVSGKTPTPGGGSVSAAVGAIGAALGAMTARYSDEEEAARTLDGIRDGLLPIVEKDAEAYGRVNEAMALPKSNPEEKKKRRAVLQAALGEAAEVPLEGMRLAVRGLETLAGLSERCNKHLASDLAGAARFLESALLGCGENVRVNAASIKDGDRARALEEERARLGSEAGAHRARVLEAVEKLYAGK